MLPSQSNKILIAVMTCHPAPVHATPQPERVLVDHTKRLPFIRESWANGLEDCRFFFGRGNHGDAQSDEIALECGDSYFETASKVQAIARWALDHGYRRMFKVDDDTYLRPERLASAGYERHSFVGRALPPEPNHPVSYPMGGCGYYLGPEMMELAANDKAVASDPDGDPLNTYEDGWIGRVAKDAGIDLVDDFRLRCHHSAWNFPDEWILNSPRRDNDIITCCEFKCEEMLMAHKNFLEG